MVGQSVTFSVSASGTGPLYYEWRKNGSVLWSANSSSYQVTSVTSSQNGTQYSVIVFNRAGKAVSNAATLTVNSAPAAVAPSITSQPASQSVTAGQSATFSVAATGTAPMSYQWMMNQVAISGATSSAYQTGATTASQNKSLVTVVVTNSAGSVTSAAAVLSVATPVVAPSITSQPASQSVNAGQSATFNVATTGTSPMTYQWERNQAAISGATSSSYQTPATTSSDNGAQFVVVVTNAAGTATSITATLTVVTPAVAPSITAQPASTSVTVGQSATFSVAVTGTAPMTYQWSKNSVAISGATSSTYQTPATASTDNKSLFTVVVTNSAGSATSSSATLTVNAAATLLLSASPSQLSFGSVNVSANGTQTATLTNTGTSSVTISNVSISGAGFTANGGPTGITLSPNQATSLTVVFSPASAGNASGTVTVASNATNSPTTVALSGTGIAQTHSVYLSWTASTSQVMGYNVYSSTVSGGPYAKITGSPVPATNYTDGSVQSSKTYYYVTTSVDSTGMESTYSSQVSANVP